MFDSKQVKRAVHCHGGGAGMCFSLNGDIESTCTCFDGKIWVSTMNYGSPKCTPIIIYTHYLQILR